MEVLGKYTLLRHLADGGMATLWVARADDGPEVVIKRLLPEMAADPDQREAFLDEARLASHLEHPNIGHVFELGNDGTTHYIVLEFIDGISLEGILEQGALHPELAAHIMVEILSALDFAHHATNAEGQALGVVHRDVNPSNILISHAGEIKLVDFGVARALTSARRTQSGVVKGKYPYMSPEQIAGQEVTAQADVFSCGVTFYELLSGIRPFGDDIRAVSAILRQAPPALPEAIPAAFVSVCMKALEKSLSDRYSSANEMKEVLVAALKERDSEVGARELSLLVRSLRGLPISAEDSQDVDPSLYATHRGQVVGLPVVSETPPDNRSRRHERRWWLAGGGFAVLALGLSIAWMIATPSEAAVTFVLGEDVIVLDGTRPEMMFSADGVPVLFNTFPSADIRHAGALIGRTPLATRLKPGNYRVELHREGVRKQATITVPEQTHFRWERELESLEDADAKKTEKPRPKPKAKRSLLDRIKRAIQ